jgi:hypothetical protein
MIDIIEQRSTVTMNSNIDNYTIPSENNKQ